MRNQLAELLKETSYDEETEVDEYKEQRPHKMSKHEFVHEMIRLQEERKLYSE